VAELQNAGIEASPRRADRVYLNITPTGVEEHSALIRDLFKGAEATVSRII
jgi:hypothetical protein